MRICMGKPLNKEPSILFIGDWFLIGDARGLGKNSTYNLENSTFVLFGQ